MFLSIPAKIKSFGLFLFLFLFSFSLSGQNGDTTFLFPLEKYLERVRTYHPVMQQAALLDNKTNAMLLEARGVFDPKWFGEYEDKSFDEKKYFRVGEAGLKIPLWWGADVKLAYLWSSGDFLNPEATLPTNGQAVIGLEVPLLQGLIFDQRRAQVQQAKLFREANEATRRSLLNELFIAAIEAYWEWAYQYEVANIYQSSLDLAEDRFLNVVESFRQGDKPAMDTLESLIQVQNRQLQWSQAKVELQNAALKLSNYLWNKDLIPLEVTALLRPEQLRSDWNKAESILPAGFFKNLAQNHPDLQTLLVKQRQLEIKEKWKREQFKPQLRFNYNFLGNQLDLFQNDADASAFHNLFIENYKWGLQFSYPLLLRKERGGLQLVRLEQLETAYKLEGKTLEVQNKIKGILQLLNTTRTQVKTQQAMVANYESLFAAENEKFRIGESSIFLLNNREQKLIEARLKLNKGQMSFQKLRWKLEWAKGDLR